MVIVGWSVDPKGLREVSGRQVWKRIVDAVFPGAIVLLHDTVFHYPVSARRGTVRGLNLALDQLREDYEFVTFPELLARGKQVKVDRFPSPPIDPLEKDPSRRPSRATE